MCDTVNAKFYISALAQYSSLVGVFSLVPPPPPPPPPESGVSIEEYGETVQKWERVHLFPALQAVCD